jgi:hypothetical protein
MGEGDQISPLLVVSRRLDFTWSCPPASCAASPRFGFLFSWLGVAVANRRHGRRERQAPAWRVCGFSPSWGSAFPGGGLCQRRVSVSSSVGRAWRLQTAATGAWERQAPAWRVCGFSPSWGSAFPGGGLCQRCVSYSYSVGVTTATFRRAKSRPVAVRPGGRATVTLVKPGPSGISLMVMSLAPVP